MGGTHTPLVSVSPVGQLVGGTHVPLTRVSPVGHVGVQPVFGALIVADDGDPM